jgi:hypothetical protein
MMLSELEIHQDYYEFHLVSKSNLQALVNYDGWSYDQCKKNIHVKLPVFTVSDRVFVDIDQLEFMGLSFNTLDYNQQVEFEMTCKETAFKILINIIENHFY